MPRLLSSPRLGRGNADLKKQCPAVPLACADAKCQGNPTAGCTSGPANYGCPCTGPPADISPSPVACLESYICSDENCQGPMNDSEAPTCQNPASIGCPCTMGFSNPAKPSCPSAISCSDDSCQGLDRGGSEQLGSCLGASLKGCVCSKDTSNPAKPTCPSVISCSDDSCQGLHQGGSEQLGFCLSASLKLCPCSMNTSNPAAQGCPSSISKCSDGSCGGHLLDGSVLDGSNQLGVCSAASLHSCPCRDT